MQHKIIFRYLVLMAVIINMAAILFHERARRRELEAGIVKIRQVQQTHRDTPQHNDPASSLRISISTNGHHARFLDGIDIIKENPGIDIFSFLTYGNVQMLPSAAPGIACNPDNITRQNVLPL